jgi:hypothetical protein
VPEAVCNRQAWICSAKLSKGDGSAILHGEYPNGYYTREFVTRFGTVPLRIARTRKWFLPEVVKKFQRPAEEVTLLIREALLPGISTRQTARAVATLTGEVVSAQTVSRITQELDRAVREFHQAGLSDEYAYLFLDGSACVCGVRRAQAGTHVDCLWDTARWHASFISFHAQPGRESGGMGRLAARSVPARAGGEKLAANRNRWVSRFGGGYSDRISTLAAPALLGAQATSESMCVNATTTK